jgi:hypothetical protein
MTLVAARHNKRWYSVIVFIDFDFNPPPMSDGCNICDKVFAENVSRRL